MRRASVESDLAPQSAAMPKADILQGWQSQSTSRVAQVEGTHVDVEGLGDYHRIHRIR